MSIDARIAELGLALPQPAAPVASYRSAIEAGGMLHISGQLPFEDGRVMTGRIGATHDLAYGRRAAEACGIMLVAQMKAALGDLDRVAQIVKLGVFVNSDPNFTDQALVANGASDLMERIFGDIGRHARAAVGVAVLPMGAAVEIDAVVAARPRFGAAVRPR